MLALSLANGFASCSVRWPHPGAQSTARFPGAPLPSGRMLRIALASSRMPLSLGLSSLFCTGGNLNLPAFMPFRALSRKTPGMEGREMRMVFGFKQRRIESCRKRSSGQDDRPESRSPDEGSLLGISPRNVIVVVAAHECPINSHKCFVLRTYEKISCKPCRMNTYVTKDLKFPRMNTYRKTSGWGVEPKSPARSARAAKSVGARAVTKSGTR